MIRFENASDYADAAASYNDWVQSFINMHAAGCNIVSYDFSNQQLLAVRLSLLRTYLIVKKISENGVYFHCH